jgi:predicted aspartyl protease
VNIPIEINGVQYRFIYDTGAQTTVISEELSKKINLKSKGEIKVHDSQNNSSKIRYGSIPQITIGENIYSDVGVAVSDFSKNKSFECFGVDGILGMNVIKLNNWKIDYSNNTLNSYSLNEKVEPSNLDSIIFQIKRGCPKTDLFVNGKSTNFLIDIGKNDDKISLSTSHSGIEYHETYYGNQSSGLFGTSAPDTIKYATVSMTDSSSFLEEHVTITQSKNFDQLIGNGFFAKRMKSIYFDFNNNVLYLERKPSKEISKEYPFSFMITSDSQLLVSAVPASNSVLQIGDLIKEVNGEVVNLSNFCMISLKIKELAEKGEDLHLKISRNNVEYLIDVAVY